jgi:hypothetical protein
LRSDETASGTKTVRSRRKSRVKDDLRSYCEGGEPGLPFWPVLGGMYVNPVVGKNTRREVQFRSSKRYSYHPRPSSRQMPSRQRNNPPAHTAQLVRSSRSRRVLPMASGGFFRLGEPFSRGPGVERTSWASMVYYLCSGG